MSDARLASPTAGGVVLLSAEDGLGDTVRPRLEAHGADCSRIVAIRAITGQDRTGKFRRGFDLGRDLAHLTSTVEQMGGCRLVVIDPISAYLGKAGENFNAEVRALLGPLAELADRHQLAVIAVTHLRKGDGAAMYRSMGSLAFVAAARGAWMICKDPRDPLQRLMLPVKNNLAVDCGGLAYRVEAVGPQGAPIVCWSADRIDETADMASQPCRKKPDDERQEVANWLARALADGPLPTTELREDAEANGFTYATLRRAFRQLSCKAIRDGVNRRWYWQLPIQDAHLQDSAR